MPAPQNKLLVVPFAQDADVAYRNDIPVEQPVSPAGAASQEIGFPPQNFLALTSGGIPPAGKDFNGILNMLSSYAVWQQGGGGFYFDQDFSDYNSGYGIGARLNSAASPTKGWLNLVDGNTNDPDDDSTGWLGYSLAPAPTGVQVAAPGAGTFTVALDPGVGFVDITPSAAATLTNVTGAYDGQIVTFTNLSGSFALTIQANANFRMAGDLGLLQNNSATFRWSASLGLWVAFNG